jgi:ABC-2 type transport system ATP-binding protein
LISLYRNVRGVSRKETETLIELFELNDYVNSPVETYSAGMLKKVSLCLAFLGNPLIIVLDEPFITLDTNAVTLLSALIYEKSKNDETIFLLSSHQEPDSQLLPGHRKFTVQDKCILPG